MNFGCLGIVYKNCCCTSNHLQVTKTIHKVINLRISIIYNPVTPLLIILCESMFLKKKNDIQFYNVKLLD